MLSKNYYYYYYNNNCIYIIYFFNATSQLHNTSDLFLLSKSPSSSKSHFNVHEFSVFFLDTFVFYRNRGHLKYHSFCYSQFTYFILDIYSLCKNIFINEQIIVA